MNFVRLPSMHKLSVCPHTPSATGTKVELREGQDCSICLQDLNKQAVTGEDVPPDGEVPWAFACAGNHVFHKECVRKQYLSNDTRCADCRRPLLYEAFAPRPPSPRRSETGPPQAPVQPLFNEGELEAVRDIHRSMVWWRPSDKVPKLRYYLTDSYEDFSMGPEGSRASRERLEASFKIFMTLTQKEARNWSEWWQGRRVVLAGQARTPPQKRIIERRIDAIDRCYDTLSDALDVLNNMLGLSATWHNAAVRDTQSAAAVAQHEYVALGYSREFLRKMFDQNLNGNEYIDAMVERRGLPDDKRLPLLLRSLSSADSSWAKAMGLLYETYRHLGAVYEVLAAQQRNALRQWFDAEPRLPTAPAPRRSEAGPSGTAPGP